MLISYILYVLTRDIKYEKKNLVDLNHSRTLSEKSIHILPGFEWNSSFSFIQPEAGTILRGLARGG